MRTTDSHVASFHDIGGALLGRLEMRPEPCAFVAHPSGTGLLLIARIYEPVKKRQFFLVEVSDRFALVSSRPIPNIDADSWQSPELVGAYDSSMVFLKLQSDQREAHLLAFRSAGQADGQPRPVTEVYRVKIPARTALAHDIGARSAYAVVDGRGSVEVTRLTAEPPRLTDTGPVFTAEKVLAAALRCVQVRTYGAECLGDYWTLRAVSRQDRPRAAADLEARAGDAAPKLLEAIYLMMDVGWFEEAEALRARSSLRFPTDAGFVIVRFSLLVADRAFGESSMLRSGSRARRYSAKPPRRTTTTCRRSSRLSKGTWIVPAAIWKRAKRSRRAPVPTTSQPFARHSKPSVTPSPRPTWPWMHRPFDSTSLSFAPPMRGWLPTIPKAPSASSSDRSCGTSTTANPRPAWRRLTSPSRRRRPQAVFERRLRSPRLPVACSTGALTFGAKCWHPGVGTRNVDSAR